MTATDRAPREFTAQSLHKRTFCPTLGWKLRFLGAACLSLAAPVLESLGSSLPGKTA